MTLSITFTTGSGATAITFNETDTSNSSVPGGPFASAGDFQRAAIQYALDNAAPNSSGTKSEVTLSSGVFSLEPAGTTGSAGCLIIKSNTVLQGAGGTPPATTLKLVSTDGHDVTGIIRTAGGVEQNDGSITTTQNVEIKGLTIDGNRANAGAGDVDGFYCGPDPNSTEYHDSNITLENVTVQNCSRYGFDPHATTTNLTFTNCTATGNKDGFTIDGCGLPGAGSGVVITGCTANNNDRHGFNVTTGSSNVLLSSITAQGNGKVWEVGGSGIVVQTGNNEVRSWTDGVTILNATVGNNGLADDAQISIVQAANVTIANVIESTLVPAGQDLIRLRGVDTANITVTTNQEAKIDFNNYTQTFSEWGNGATYYRIMPFYNISINSVMQAPSSETGTWNFDNSTGTRPSQEISARRPILKHEPPEDVPITRIVDPDLTGRMVEFVVLHSAARLYHLRRMNEAAENQRRELWTAPVFPPARNVTVGLMGVGEMGRACAQGLMALGFNVIGWGRSPRGGLPFAAFSGAGGLDAFLAQTDILVSTLPSTPQARGLIDAAVLEKLRRDGPFGAPVLINAGRGVGSEIATAWTARGVARQRIRRGLAQREAREGIGRYLDLYNRRRPLSLAGRKRTPDTACEDDLLRALRDGTLRAASLDVFVTEPLPASSPFWGLANVVVTPHNAADERPGRRWPRRLWPT